LIERRSIQEALYPQLMCFGCGPANPHGLHLHSYADGERVVAEFTPWPEHDNGTGFLNGGIISTVLDCHGGAVAMHEGAQRGWTSPADGSIPFVTAGFDVRFLRPTPLDRTIHLVGWAERVDAGEIVVHTQIEADDKVRATMLATWKRFRPR
jgi:acyl-coenzyme A thioesterase PaaI-like protein